MKNNKTIRHIILSLMVAVLFVFMIVLILLRQSVSQIGQDPSLNLLNSAATIHVSMIINLNKNHYPDRLDECWNQMNPLVECTPENTITEGNYTIRGLDSNWLEKTEDFEIPKEHIADRTYYQKIHITYPEPDVMKVRVEIWNNFGEKVSLEITLTKE